MRLGKIMPKALSFKGREFNTVENNGQPCITLSEIAAVLYGKSEHETHASLGESKGTPQSAGTFANACKRLNELYQRHADEFTETMTAMVKLHTAGGVQMVRVFSLRGCHLLGMLARTPVAKEFRRWALDVIENRDKAANETLPLLYRALADYSGEKAVASTHGHGLSRWKKIKPGKEKAIDKLMAIVQPGLFMH